VSGSSGVILDSEDGEEETLKAHPAADIFPLLVGDHFEQLKEDIARNGQRLPIQIWEGQIIDGRNRARACRELGIRPRYELLRELPEESPVQYVLALNLRRRHLSPGQRALVAARTRQYFDEGARLRRARKRDPERFPEVGCGDARDQAGATVGVSGRSVDYATKVLSYGAPEVIDACEQGQIPIATAARLVQLPHDKQRAAIAGGRSVVTTALKSLAPSTKFPASEELTKLIAAANRLELALTQKYGGLIQLLQSPDYDQRLAPAHISQLSQLGKSLASIAKAGQKVGAVRSTE